MKRIVKSFLIIVLLFSGTSQEMELNVHVTPCAEKVLREITYIFPNCKENREASNHW